MKFFAFLLLIFLGTCHNFSIENCPKLPKHTPKNIRDLAPSSVNVIGMIGDSISAGFGMHGKEGGLDEFRGQVSTIGGDPNQITVPNFLKHYNPNLKGYSTGRHFAELPGEGHYANDHLNAAQSGARKEDVSDQLDYIIHYMESNPNISMDNDWKVISFLLGANDVCPLCWDPLRPSPEQVAQQYEDAISRMIDKMYARIPKLFLNILPMFNVSGIYNLSLERESCEYFHDVFPFECPCAFDSDYAHRHYLDESLHLVGARLMKLADSWKNKQLPEFYVTYQPFTYNIQVADFNIDFISTLDCFHPSLLADQALAVNVWNSLISTVKPQRLDVNATVICPTPNTRLS